MNTTNKERLSSAIDWLRSSRIVLSQAEFAEKIGIKPSQISEMLNGKRPISERTIRNIVNTFPGLNSEWLLTGDGEMTAISNQGSVVDGTSFVKLLPITAQGGTLDNFVMTVKDEDCETVISPIRGIDFAMTVTGDSMSPEYPNGSQILIKRINENAFIDWGRVYVLDTCNGSVIKRLFPSENPKKVKCTSINPEYPSFEVFRDDVHGFYRVMLCMSIK